METTVTETSQSDHTDNSWSSSVKLGHAVWGHPRRTGHGGEVWQNVVHWRREWQTTSVFLPWELHEQCEQYNKASKWYKLNIQTCSIRFKTPQCYSPFVLYTKSPCLTAINQQISLERKNTNKNNAVTMFESLCYGRKTVTVNQT